MNAKHLIEKAEKAAEEHQRRTGCDDAERTEYELCSLQGKLRDACDALAAVTNPANCVEVESEGVRYGLQWCRDDGVWAVYIGGQEVTPFVAGPLYKALCAEAEEMALAGRAA